MKSTREMSRNLLLAPEVTPLMIAQASTIIDTLCDVIEVTAKPAAPDANLGPLRELRQWHYLCNQDASLPRLAAVRTLNQYFPKDDQL
jgi:hypothetical protein